MGERPARTQLRIMYTVGEIRAPHTAGAKRPRRSPRRGSEQRGASGWCLGGIGVALGRLGVALGVVGAYIIDKANARHCRAFGVFLA